MNNKLLFRFLLLFIISFTCSQNKEPLGHLIPSWLDEEITEMENNNYYGGTVIYRHEWRLKHYYHIEIPVSSCAYCEVYNELGEKMVWNESLLKDYLQNRKNEIIVWGYPN